MEQLPCSTVVLGTGSATTPEESNTATLLSGPLVRDLLNGTRIPEKGQCVTVSVVNTVRTSLVVLGATVADKENISIERLNENVLSCSEETTVILLREGEWYLKKNTSDKNDLVTAQRHPPYWNEAFRTIQYLIYGDKQYQNALESLQIEPAKTCLLEGEYGTGKSSLLQSISANNPDILLINATASNIFDRALTKSQIIEVIEFFIRAGIAAKPALVVFDDASFAFPKSDNAAAAAFVLAIRKFRNCLDGVGVVVVASPNEDVLHPLVKENIDVSVRLPAIPTNEDAEYVVRKASVRAGVYENIASEQIGELAPYCTGLLPADVLDAVNHPGVHKQKKYDAFVRAIKVNLEQMREERKQRKSNAAFNVVEASTLKEKSSGAIGGLLEVKEVLDETIIWALQEDSLFESYGLRPSPCVLLYGPPGTGKTMLARHVAISCDAAMITVDAAVLAQGEVGASEKTLKSIFEQASSLAPTLIFMDELDALFLSKESAEAGDSASSRRLVSCLLMELDGLSKKVAVLGASNRPWAIDTVLLSAGRFDRCVHVPLPDEAQREFILQLLADKMELPAEARQVLMHMKEDTSTKGWSGADLTGACRKAAMQALSQDTDILGKHIRDAFLNSSASVDPEVARRFAQWHPP